LNETHDSLDIENGLKLSYLKVRKSNSVFIYAGIFIAIYIGLIAYRAFFFPPDLLENILLLIAVAYTLLVTASVLSRFPIAYRFNPSKYIDIEYEPTVTLIVPAFNEEEIIEQTIEHTLASKYPKDKLEVLVVNDGSKDRTGEICQSYADRNLITFINFPENRGKREGLYEGFKRARGEIVVVIDSDTFIRDDCVSEIVKPLVDPKIGGVCGHTDVNNRVNLLAKFQQANYFVGFHLHKKAESLFSNVSCLSGCASAYRKSELLGFIDAWKNQHFLGVQCTYGEDRALTTFLLRRGLDIVYTPSARAVTHVPETLKKLLKQRIRWKRSFIRETWLQSKFMYKRSVGGALLFYSFSLTNVLSPFISAFYLVFLPIVAVYGMLTHTVPFGISAFTATIVYTLGMFFTSALYAFYSKLYTKFPISWTIGWSFFNTIIISFGSIYAYFTVKSRKWMTR
jgi:hyaluronan synthase